MHKDELILLLKQKPDIDDVVIDVMKDTQLIPVLFEIIETEKSSVKFSAEKIIRIISQKDANMLLPYFNRMVALLDSENTFIRYGFILSVPNLFSLDQEKKWVAFVERYILFLESTAIAEFNNAVSNVWKILKQYPDYESVIVPKLLQIDQHVFLHKGERSLECIDVAKGQIIDCFIEIYERSVYQKEMRAFVTENAQNHRKKVQASAKRFLRAYSYGSSEEDKWKND